MTTLDLGVIGNGTFGALVDPRGKVVWCCLPRFDGDPVFYDLLNGGASSGENGSEGFWSIELLDQERSEQSYVANTAVLRTRLYDSAGNGIEIDDFAPRFQNHERMFRPTMIVRRVRRLNGTPRIRICLRPRFGYGSHKPSITHGSNHIRYVDTGLTMRLTTDASLQYVLDETPFVLADTLHFLFGPDETLAGGIQDTARAFQEKTEDYWTRWVRRLALPFEWQEAVIRAAITLKLCAFEETGAIVAAMTTSIPEAPDSGRNWDYRYCWLRDAFFVVRALNSLSAVETMEDYLRYLLNIVLAQDGGHLQPVYGLGQEAELSEREVGTLSGYRGMGPVRVGNQAHEHLQHDVYGNVILAASQSFFDSRLFRQATRADFDAFEKVGERAYQVYNQPDAGMWELRTRARIHTSSSVMCWAACDRLARIAASLGHADRAELWQTRAREIHAAICDRAWSDRLQSFVESFDGESLDAGLLLMTEVNFIEPSDPRFGATLNAIEKVLRRGPHMFRYATEDDFGMPKTAFNICTFWYIDALARVGRRDEAREIFETMLACRNSLGLLSEDIDTTSGEMWGNYPQTYSLVGIINAATRLSRRWEDEV